MITRAGDRCGALALQTGRLRLAAARPPRLVWNWQGGDQAYRLLRRRGSDKGGARVAWQMQMLMPMSSRVRHAAPVAKCLDRHGDSAARARVCLLAGTNGCTPGSAPTQRRFLGVVPGRAAILGSPAADRSQHPTSGLLLLLLLHPRRRGSLACWSMWSPRH